MNKYDRDHRIMDRVFVIALIFALLGLAFVRILNKKNNMEAEDLLDKFAQDEGFGNWETVVLNCHHSVIRSVAIAAVNQALHQPLVVGRSEQLTAFAEWLEDKGHPIHNILLQEYIRWGG